MNIPDFYVIVVEPKYSGNIGAIARVMANFDFKNLYLVGPCNLDDECYQRAVHAQDILKNAKIFKDYKKAFKEMDYLVATSSIESDNDKKHLRNATNLEDLTGKLVELKGKVGLIFGREDYGLYNEEIALCDSLLRIPTSDAYLSMNLSHAVGIVLYSLFIKKDLSKKETKVIEGLEKEKLYGSFETLLNKINYPEHKKDKTNIMFKRLMGRAMPSKWEYHTLMGVFSKTLKKIKDKK